MRQNDIDAFFALLRGGLWSNDNLNLDVDFDGVDWGEVYQLAEDQSVVGLVAAGIDYFKGRIPSLIYPQEWVLQFIGQSLQIEQQNSELNKFIRALVEKMRKADIYALLVKGQGIAQCYEKPLWRACGDVDLLLSGDNYKKAKAFLLPMASEVEPEGKYEQHLGLTILDTFGTSDQGRADGWVVELHGSLRSGLSARIDKVLDEVKKALFYGGSVRSWNNGNTQVFLPSADNDAVYIFTHILQHFYKGGIGLRKICDWCRLLWTYRESLNYGLLESRIRKMGLMSEGRAFGVFAVEYLGMDAKAVPFLNLNDNANVNRRLKRKAERLKDFIMMSGNFGHNRDMSYYDKYPYLVRKVISLGRRCGDLFRHARVFPLDSLKFSFWIMLNGVRSAMRGE